MLQQIPVENPTSVTDLSQFELFKPGQNPIFCIPGIGCNVDTPPFGSTKCIDETNDHMPIVVGLNDIYNGELCVPDISVMVERVSDMILAFHESYPDKKITVASHSLGCLVTAMLPESTLELLGRIVFVAPVYSNQKSNQMVDKYGEATEPVWVEQHKYYISTGFINSMRSIDCVKLFDSLFTRYPDLIKVVVAAYDKLACNQDLIHFVESRHLPIEIENIDTNHYFSDPQALLELGARINAFSLF